MLNKYRPYISLKFLLKLDLKPLLQNDLARILAKDAGDDDFIESDEEVDPELMAEKVYEDVEEAREDKKKRNAMKVYSSLTTNTALTILRFCGQYLQMADALHPVAFEVIRALCSLYDVYIYAVYQFFTEKMKGKKFDLIKMNYHVLVI